MSCADVCLSMDYDGDANDFFRETTIGKSRTKYFCCECGDPIPVGASYVRASGKSYGGLWTNATCLDCYDIRDAFVCGSWIYGNLWEAIRSEMFPVWIERGEYDCLAKLTRDTAITKCNQEYNEWLEERS